jgi:branched-chain amino acid transport system ATP-binding protein
MSAAAPVELLWARGVTVDYGGTRANDAVDLAVGAGQFVGLIGANGAGKSTFIDAITGFTPPSAGTVHFDGREITGDPTDQRARAGMARTFQSLELFEDLTVWDNMLVASEDLRWWALPVDVFRRRARAEVREAAERALTLVGLAELRDQLPINLSHGQRKLVAVARALASGPKLLLLDEPAAGLDVHESLALGGVLRQLVDQGIAILLVDHDMALVLSVCDEVCVLDAGAVIAHGTPAEIRTNEAVLASYLGASQDEPAPAPLRDGAAQ